jgi:transcriptional regulator with XRE-family HTH domain
MEIRSENTDATVLRELGSRVARTRLERNISQEQLAHEAGIGRATLERLEAGHPVKLDRLVRVLRALDLLENLNLLVPEPLPSPIQQLARHGHRRQRAGRPRRSEPAPRPDEAWTWGDEQQ